MTKIDIFSGFLGAGKTTLIKKLLKEAYVGEQLVLNMLDGASSKVVATQPMQTHDGLHWWCDVAKHSLNTQH